MRSRPGIRSPRQSWSPHYPRVHPSEPGWCLVEIRGVLGDNLIKEGTVPLTATGPQAWREILHLADGNRDLARRILAEIANARIIAIATAVVS